MDKERTFQNKVLPKEGREIFGKFFPYHTYYIWISVGISLAIVISVLFFYNNTKAYVAENQNYKIVLTYNPFKNTDLVAKSAYVYDVKKGKSLFAKNSREPLAIASITKLMTALVATENTRPDTQITVTPDTLYTEGESGLIPYEL